MNNSGDAAEQIVRMSLQGVEVAARVTGTAAKELALLIITALKSENKGHMKYRGKERLKSMLKSGKPLEIYSLKERDLKRFAKGAKEYGIVYCVLRNTKGNPDGLCDIMVRADDAPKIARVAERFKFATVDKAKIEREIMDSRAERADTPNYESSAPTEQDDPDIGDTEKLIDDILGTSEGKAEPDTPELSTKETVLTKKSEPVKADAEVRDSRPLVIDGKPSSPSEPISEPSKSFAKDSTTVHNKPSVRGEIRDIRASQKAKVEEGVKREDRNRVDRKRKNYSPKHQQPQNSGKTKKSKGSR